MSHAGKQAGKQQVRIIGGQWRGRKLSFKPAAGLRPTGDRIRETLFNWLAADIQGAKCADLFAGTGALGLEALSRGAAHCDFVDSSPAALHQISEHLGVLGATERGHCIASTAEDAVEQATAPYDILFLDAPFQSGLIQPAIHALSRLQIVRAGALVYIETHVKEGTLITPVDWHLHRDKRAGAVAYRLYRVSPLSTAR